MKRKTELSPDIKHGLWTLLLRTRQIMYKARQQELREYAIPTHSSGALRTILRLGEGATPSEISRQLFLEPHSVSELLKRMENAGLIRRFKDPTKRKNLVRVELTEKGREACKASSDRKAISGIISNLTPREQLELWHILAKLRAAGMRYLGMKDSDLYPPANPDEHRETTS